jgi:hypothetical protein
LIEGFEFQGIPDGIGVMPEGAILDASVAIPASAGFIRLADGTRRRGRSTGHRPRAGLALRLMCRRIEDLRPGKVGLTRRRLGSHRTECARKEALMRIRSALIAATSVLVLAIGLSSPSASVSATDELASPACTITGTGGPDRLQGTDGPDVICARAGNDHVFGKGGDDVLLLGRGRDHFSGGGGDDRVIGGSGRDAGFGGGGNDRIFLLRGSDLAEDMRGTDLIVGGRGDDLMCVYDGRPNAPKDRILGGPGPDYAGADLGDVVRSVEIEFYGGCWD